MNQSLEVQKHAGGRRTGEGGAPGFRVTRLCEWWRPQNYYARRRAGRQWIWKLLLELVVRVQRKGSRVWEEKLYHLIGAELQAAGVKMGRDRMFAGLRKSRAAGGEESQQNGRERRVST